MTIVRCLQSRDWMSRRATTGRREMSAPHVSLHARSKMTHPHRRSGTPTTASQTLLPGITRLP